MKVLWVGAHPLEDLDSGTTGTWQTAMAQGLLSSGAVELGIIGYGRVKQFTRADYREVPQWSVPVTASNGRNGLPSASLIQRLIGAVDEFRPDLVHVWGTEYYWGLLTARGILRFPSLLEMQGLKGDIAKVFYGGLSPLDRLRCIGFKEVLKHRTLYHERRDFVRWGAREREIIKGHRFIDFQSPWMGAQVCAINPEARLFKVDRALRSAFENADPWQGTKHPVVFTTAAYMSPFKGLHVAIQAVASLRKHCPAVRLRIAGSYQKTWIRQSGYAKWLKALIRAAEMEGTIEWLGALSASQIVKELQSASAALLPTFAESYCVAMAEAMHIGTPIVAAFTGGTAHLGRDEETCLFFPPGDVAMCTFQLERVLSDRKLAVSLSRQGRVAASVRHDSEQLIQNQLTIYQQVLKGGYRA